MWYYINVLEKSTTYAEVVVTLERTLCMCKVTCLTQSLGTICQPKDLKGLFFMKKCTLFVQKSCIL